MGSGMYQEGKNKMLLRGKGCMELPTATFWNVD